MIKIQNRPELLKNLPVPIKKRREALFTLVEHVLNHLQPVELFRKKWPRKDVKKFQKIAIFSIGKAAKSMAEAAIQLLLRKPDLVLLADEGHPFPTEKGFQKTKKMMAAAKKMTKDDLAIVLISGGGSAMFVCPAEGISLKDQMAVTRELLKSGAPIQEVNTVRKQLSQVKGGQFAQLLYPATVWGFVISDVIGNDLSKIASGPISPDDSTARDALKIIRRYQMNIPKNVLQYLEKKEKKQSPEQSDKTSVIKNNRKYFQKVSVKIVADHWTALKIAEEKAKKMGLRVETREKLLAGEAREVAKTLVLNHGSTSFISSRPIATRTTSRTLAKRGTLFLAAGETTVTLRGEGFGGRNQEFVLSGLKFLKPGQTLLSIGTDGIDGVTPEKVAGAIADEIIEKRAQKDRLNIDDFLRHNDSFTFFKKIHGLIKTGSTGTNVGDLMMCLNYN